MKKVFIYFVFFMFSASCFSQLQNGNFETWSTTTIETPDSWDCSSAINFAIAELITPLHKTTDKYEGQYALEMITMAGATKNFVGINNGYWNPTLMSFTSGFPFTNQIDTLEGWYKYTPKQTGGTGKVSIEFKKSGVSFGNTVMNIVANSNWTKFEIPFDLAQAPDSAVIMMNTCNTPLNLADTGSVLIIDAIQFKSAPLPSGVQELTSEKNILVSPNPSTGEFDILYTPKNNSSATYTIYDDWGREIKNGKLKNPKTAVDLSGNSKGLYFLTVTDGNITSSKRIIIQ